MSKNQNDKDKATLLMLEQEVEAELKRSENKKSNKNKGKGNRTREGAYAPSMPEELDAAPTPKEEVSRDTAEFEPMPDLPPAIEEKGTPFDSMAEEMSEQGKALSKNKPKKNRRENSRQNEEEKKPSSSMQKSLDPEHSKKLGEEITKEQAQEIMEGKIQPKGRGHRATIIMHTKVVGEDGSKAEDVMSRETDTEKPNEAAPAQVASQARRLIRVETGEVFDFTGDISIGRSEDNDLCIPNPDGYYVSWEHAKIYEQGKDVYVKDLDSRNGTYINDRKIKTKRIRTGDIVEFGDVKFKYETD